MSDEKNMQDNNLKKKILIIAAALICIALIVLIVVMIYNFSSREEQKKASGKGKYKESNQSDGDDTYGGETNIFDVAIREYESGITEETVPEDSETTVATEDTESADTTQTPTTTQAQGTTSAPTTTQAPVTECPHSFETIYVEATGHWETVTYYTTVNMMTWTCNNCGYSYQAEGGYSGDGKCSSCGVKNFSVNFDKIEKPVYEDVWVEDTPSYSYEKCAYCGMVR